MVRGGLYIVSLCRELDITQAVLGVKSVCDGATEEWRDGGGGASRVHVRVYVYTCKAAASYTKHVFFSMSKWADTIGLPQLLHSNSYN